MSNVSILKRKSADADALRKAKELYKEAFKKITKDDEDSIVADFRSSLNGWQTEASELLGRASLQFYPGKELLQNAITKIKQQLNIRDSYEFVALLNQQKNDLLNFAEDLDSIKHFYTSQVGVWSSMLDALNTANENHTELEHIPEAQQAIDQLKQIRINPTPWGVVSKIPALVETLKQQNAKVIKTNFEYANGQIEKTITVVKQNLAQYGADENLSNRILRPLQEHLNKVQTLTNVARIKDSVPYARSLMDNAVHEIEDAMRPKPEPVVPASPAGSVLSAGVTPTTPTPPKPQPKPISVVSAQSFSQEPYLETPEAVEAYVEKLKTHLLELVRSGKRARIE